MGKRLERVNELLRREISAVVQRDFEWKNALVTITDVDVTQDLKEAKVFVSILGGSTPGILRSPPPFMQRLQSLTGSQLTSIKV